MKGYSFNFIENDANVARAIFSPQMVDATGNITRAAFSLRHRENYISVCLMSADSWLDDVMSIPVNIDRTLVGYGILNVGDVRQQSFMHNEHNIVFDVIDKHTARNKSHAGIVISFDGTELKGDNKVLLKPLSADTPAKPLLLRIQSRLLKLAMRHYVKWPGTPVCRRQQSRGKDTK